MLKQKLQQKLLQRLSPQQIQVIKLLEIPTVLLEQRIKKELDENPTLELESDPDEEVQYPEESAGEAGADPNDEEFSVEDYLNDEDLPSYRLAANNYSRDHQWQEMPYAEGLSFRESLEAQLSLRPLDPRQKQLGIYLLGNIDDDGYLRRKLSAIADDLGFALGIATRVQELEQVLRIIQDLDPPGVGARDLQECLLIQIRAKDGQLPGVANAQRILKTCFEEFTRKHYDRIQARLALSDGELRQAMHEILKLNPKPGGSLLELSHQAAQPIIPDFILEVQDDELVVSLNARNAPDLKVSREYAQMLEVYAANRVNATQQDREAVNFVKQKIDSARWFIDAIKQRQNTLMTTMRAIIEFQREFFQEGNELKLKPMILKDIATITGFDISTISRVANSKFIQTHFGIFPLKHFFSEGIQNDSGEEVSTKEIKKILQDCLDSEDKRKPLNDEQLMRILHRKGYPIARRTVAKYREQLGIAVARLRREL